MSSCPSRDIHSVYLDNEMPAEFKAEYEKHLETCPACKKELESMKALSALFKADSQSITLDKDYMDKSFERLQIKMKYNKNVSESNKKKSKGFRVFVPLAAAAAAVFAIALPITLSSNSNPKEVNLSSIIASKIPSTSVATLTSGYGKVVSGNIRQVVLSSGTAGKSSPSVVAGTTVSNSNAGAKLIDEVNVFKPSFSREAKTNSIKVQIPTSVSITKEFGITVVSPVGQH